MRRSENSDSQPVHEPCDADLHGARLRDDYHVEIAERARRLMEESIGTPLTIAQISAACNASPTTVKESFKRVHGVSMYRWQRNLRMRAASDLLLESRRTVADVAAEVGYSNPSKFSKAFRDCLGVSPSQWRQNGTAGQPTAASEAEKGAPL